MAKKDHNPIAEYLLDHINHSPSGKRRLKLRTLLKKFGYKRRSDSNMEYITQCLTDAGIAINPPLIRFNDAWEFEIDDSIYISALEDDYEGNIEVKSEGDTTYVFNNDGWFDNIKKIKFGLEHDVNDRFVLPLLYKLGYNDADILKNKKLPNSNSRPDYVLFNNRIKKIINQPLLIVESKRRRHLEKEEDLQKTFEQAKKYSKIASCHFFVLTDGYNVYAYRKTRRRNVDFSLKNDFFCCKRRNLLQNFDKLHSVLSKDALTNYYSDFFSKCSYID